MDLRLQTILCVSCFLTSDILLVSANGKTSSDHTENALKFSHVTPAVTPAAAPRHLPCAPAASTLLLTPSWNLVFGEGEQVQIACGFCTGDTPEDFELTWLNNKSEPVANVFKNEPRMYSVLTLNLTSLTLADTGTYTCRVTSHTNVIPATDVSIKLEVRPTKQQCGFESPDNCGWTATDDDHAAAGWTRHRVSDVTHANIPAFDHTYGPSSSSGHFLHFGGTDTHDVAHDGEHKATLTSQHFDVTDTRLCVHYWYAIATERTASLRVILRRKTTEMTWVSDVMTLHNKSTNSAWVHAMAQIEKQTTRFRIAFEAELCGPHCSDDCVAIDDIQITEGSCPGDANHAQVTDRLTMRLVGGSHEREGRLEVLRDGQYGTVCGSGTMENAQVVCRSLGYSTTSAEVLTGSATRRFGEAPHNQQVWLRNLQCTGSEQNLAQCLSANTKWGITSEECKHKDDVIISCAADTSGVVGTAHPAARQTAAMNLDQADSLSPNTTSPVITSPVITSPVITSPVSTSTSTTSLSTSSTTLPITVPTTVPSTSLTTRRSTSSTTLPTTSSTTAAAVVTNRTAPTTTTTTITTTPLQTSSSSPSSSSSAAGPIPAEAGSQTTPSTHHSSPDTKQTHKQARRSNHSHARVGIAVVLGIITLAILFIAYVMYKGRKRRLRKNKYQSFGESNYSTEHLPTNEFHMETPLAMSNMGYTVLA